MVFQVNVLALVDDELEVDLQVGQLLHAVEPALLPLPLVLALGFADGLVQNGFDVVNDVLEDAVVHLREDHDLEERLDRAQEVVGVGPDLVDE